MAKAKDLAALAALAGLAYVNRDKLFGGKDKDKSQSSGMTPEQNDELATANRISKLSGESDALARSNKGMSPGQSALDSTNVGVLNALGAPKTAPNDKAPSQGVLSPKSITPKAAPKAAAAKQAPSDPRNLEAGMSRGTVNREELTKNRAKSEFPDASSRFEGDNYTTVTNARALNEKLNREAGSGTSSGYKTDAMKVASRAAAAADRQRKMAQQSSYKSGGMTSSASSRADGIATKGKTRGKIC